MVSIPRPGVIIGIFVSHIQFAICTVYSIQTESNNQLEIIESSSWSLVNMLHERKWDACGAVDDLWTNFYQVEMSFFTHSLKVSSSQRSSVPTDYKLAFTRHNVKLNQSPGTWPPTDPHPNHLTHTSPETWLSTTRYNLKENQLIYSDLGWKAMELLSYNQIYFSPTMIERKSFHQRINCIASASGGLAVAVCVHFFRSIRFIFDNFPTASPPPISFKLVSLNIYFQIVLCFWGRAPFAHVTWRGNRTGRRKY